MKIVNSTLQLTATHALTQQHEVSEHFEAWANRRSSPPPSADVHISEGGKAAAEAGQKSDAVDDATQGDPRLALIRSLLELFTGRPLKVFDAQELTSSEEATANNAQQQVAPRRDTGGWGMVYEHHESYTESEQTSFSASGSVRTSDGREIGFEMQLSMTRTFHQQSDISLRLGDAARKTDPLVLNFSGTAAQLVNQRFAFDLNADGQSEQINFVGPGSGFLVFDRNRDGKINDGRELFGPQTNDGFQELSALDSDGNGWIDENDPAFAELQVWTRDADGSDQLRSLASLGVGAIGLNNVATPFALKTESNRTLGEIRNSGIFLLESGTTGTIQQIDLTA